MTLHPAEATAATWSKLYDPDAEHAIWGTAPAEYVTTVVADRWRATGARDILVMPCGDGRNILPLAAEFTSIVASDAAPRAIETLHVNFARAGLTPPETIQGDLYDPPFEGRLFDAVLSWDVFSHLERPADALCALDKLLRPGAGCSINVYADDDPSIRGDHMREIDRDTLMSPEGICYWLYSIGRLASLIDTSKIGAASIETIDWWEEPHPGYREYRHRHRGHVLSWRKATLP